MTENDRNLIGGLHIGLSSLGIVAALIVYTAVVGGGAISGDPSAMAITRTVGNAIAMPLFLLALPGFIGGIALIMNKGWAPPLVTVVAVVNLINIPFGTAVGIFTLIRFYGDTKEREHGVPLESDEPSPADPA